MIREFDKLEQGPFDLLVIGGGIYGAWIAYDATLRGLRVALVERHDWAAGTSSACSKLIHGGLRYLEQARFGLVRRALRERRRLLRLAPHRVRPMRFALPIYAGGRAGRFKLGLGLWAYDALAGRSSRMKGHRRLDRRDMLRRYGFLNPAGLRAGFTFPDCSMDDARFVVELVDGASGLGAIAVNRAEASELLVDGGKAVGARIEDAEGGGSLELLASVTVNCAGAWAQSLIRSARPSAPPFARLSKGIHLVMPGLPSEDGFLLLSRQHGGVVFLIPWYGRTVLGTTDTEYDGDPDRVRALPTDGAYLLAQANRALKDAPWRESDVISGFAGLRTLPASGDSPSAAVSRELRLEEPLPGLLCPVGGKYTSARLDAARIVDRILRRLGRFRVPTPTEREPFPWRPRRRYRSWLRETMSRGLELGLDESVVTSCQSRYGSRLDLIYALIEESPDLGARIDPAAPFCFAEVVHAVKHEMARSLEDVLRRRIPLTLLCRPNQVALLEAADLAGPHLGWSDRRKHEEVASVFREPGVSALG